MALTDAQLTTLRAEFTNDPRGYGYAPLAQAGDDQGLAAKLNLQRDGSAGTVPTTPTGAGGVVTGIITVKRPDVTPAEILEAIDIRDFPAAPQGVNSVPLCQSWLESVTQFAKIRLLNDNGQKSQTRKNIDRLVGDTNLSQTRLDALATRAGSRFEELFGFGAQAQPFDIGGAR